MQLGFYGLRILRVLAGIEPGSVKCQKEGYRTQYLLHSDGEKVVVDKTVASLLHQGLLVFDEELRATEKGLAVARGERVA